MSWLKKIGQIAVAVGKVSPVAGPILAAIIPGDRDDVVIGKATAVLDPIIAKIIDVEMIGAALTLTGPQKLTAATPLIAQALAPYVAKVGVEDEALFKSGCEKVAAGMVDVLNSLKEPARA